ncbi:MAG: ParB N-terminal domain-containing protein [Janthinobacterium lividum]
MIHLFLSPDEMEAKRYSSREEMLNAIAEETQDLRDFLKSIDNKERNIKPHWFMSADDKHLIDAGYGSWEENGEFRTTRIFNSQGVTLIEVNLFSLLNSIHFSIRQKLLNGKYLRESRKTLKILREWESSTKLTAPCCAIMQNRKLPQILDGHHRISAAIALGESTIPIIIPEAQLDRFRYATSLERKVLIKTNLI